MDWLEASFRFTALFSLKPSWATSSGGKTLLAPTPYAIKMALLDAAIRTSGLEEGRRAWPWLRDLQIHADLPAKIVVTNLFEKILRERRRAAPPGTADAGPFQKTIGYREYVYYAGPLRLQFGLAEAANEASLRSWLMQVTYLGRRGGFLQLLGAPEVTEENDRYIRLTADPTEVDARGLLQQMDDCGQRMTFNDANIYDSKRPQRIVRHIVLPYRLAHSSKSYSLYERIE